MAVNKIYPINTIKRHIVDMQGVEYRNKDIQDRIIDVLNKFWHEMCDIPELASRFLIQLEDPGSRQKLVGFRKIDIKNIDLPVKVYADIANTVYCIYEKVYWGEFNEIVIENIDSILLEAGIKKPRNIVILNMDWEQYEPSECTVSNDWWFDVHLSYVTFCPRVYINLDKYFEQGKTYEYIIVDLLTYVGDIYFGIESSGNEERVLRMSYDRILLCCEDLLGLVHGLFPYPGMLTDKYKQYFGMGKYAVGKDK